MEPHGKEELTRARDALREELATLYRFSGDVGPKGPLPVVEKLRKQIAALTELLEGEGTSDA